MRFIVSLILLITCMCSATVSDSYATDTFSTNGSTTEFDFDFPISALTDVKATLENTTTGALTDLAYTTEYSVASSDYTAGGTVTTVSTYASGYTLHIYRDTSKDQTVDLESGTAFNPSLIEARFDKTVMVLQELEEAIGRSIRFPEADFGTAGELSDATTRANTYLSFDSDGDLQLSSASAGGVTFGTFGQTLAENATLAAVLDDLNLVNTVVCGTDFDDEIASIGVSAVTLIVNQTTTCSANTTIPSTVDVVFLKGGQLSVDAGVTATFSGTVQAGLFQIFAGSGSVALNGNSTVYPQWFAGANAGAQINAALGSLPSTGGIVDARGYVGDQTVSASITVGGASKPEVLLCNQACTFKPSAADVYIFDVDLNGQVHNATVDTTDVTYSVAVAVFDESYGDSHITGLWGCNFIGTNNEGIGVLFQGDGYVGLDFITIENLRTAGYDIGISLYAAYSSGSDHQWINGNYFNNIEIKDADIGIKLDATGSAVVEGNYFSNIAFQDCDEICLDIEVGDRNLFLNLTMWDTPSLGGAFVVKSGSEGNYIHGYLNVQTVAGTYQLDEPENTVVIDLLTTRPLMGKGAAGTYAVATTHTWDPGSIADGDEEAVEVDVATAELGDFALASFSLDVEDLVLNAQVTAAGKVTCVLANNTGGAKDLLEGTLYIRIFEP